MSDGVHIVRSRLAVGLPAPVRVIHISDPHLTIVSERDNERKHRLCEARKRAFPLQSAVLQTAKEISLREHIPIVCTGDLIDFVSDGNLAAAKRFMRETDALFVAGNHEFSQYVGEAKEDAAYREQSLPEVEAAFGGDVRFVSRLVGGVNFVGIDDGYYQFDAWQSERLREEIAKGYPVVLLLHVPLFGEALFRRVMYRGEPYETGTPCAGSAELVGVGREWMKDYSASKREAQLPTAVTKETVEFIESCGRVAAILTGHWHFDHIAKTARGIPQVITGCETVRIVEFV